MSERTLLERLRDPRGSTGRSAQINTSALAESVQEHLDRMLNTRQGIAETVPDYGLPNLVDVIHSFPEAVDICRRSIRSSIERYEPRLRNVVVNAVPNEDDPFHLRFEIRAQLISDNAVMPVAFYTTLDSSGQADVGR